MKLTKRINKELFFLVGITFIFVMVNALWIWNYRNSGVFDIDEAGYLSISLTNYQHLEAEGLWGWIKSVESPSIQAPVTTAVSSFFYMVFWPQPYIGFMTIIFFGTVTVLGTYYLGKSLGGNNLGMLTSILVATCPLIINYSRSYSFAIPATAVTTLALLGLVRSNHFVNWKWAMVFGVFLGLMPLTRTMTIAFVPGMVLAAIAAIFGQSKKTHRSWGILTGSLLLGAVTAMTWLLFNGALVLQYLTSFGYGSRVVEFASSGHQTFLSNLLSITPLIQYILNNIYLPDLLFLLLGGGVLVAVVVRNFLNKGPYRGIQSLLNSKMLPISIFVGAGLLAITSSQNKGSGFLAPLMPGLFLLATWAMTRYKYKYEKKTFQQIAWLPVSIVALISGLPFISLALPIATPWEIDLPLLNQTTITDGNGTLQLYESAGGYTSENPNIPIDNITSKQWERASITTASELTQLDGMHKLTAFGFRNRLFNVNTVNLQQLLSGRDGLPLSQVEPVVTGDSPAGYLRWLKTGDAANATLLVTAAEGKGDFPPLVTPKYMETAAKNAGFSVLYEHFLPEGREIKVWRRNFN